MSFGVDKKIKQISLKTYKVVLGKDDIKDMGFGIPPRRFGS